MGYALRPGTHFCDVGDRLVFLDLAADRYFCLSRHAEAAFRRLTGPGHRSSALDPAIDVFVRGGLLVPISGEIGPAPCRAPPIPTVSALDACRPKASMPHLVAALGGLVATTAALRLFGLKAILDSLARAKAHVQLEELHDDVAAVAAAFQQTARLARSHDRCLPRSVAVARRLVELGSGVHLVIGVQLRPFAAHCWAQTGECIVNDRFDQVRAYQPILVI
jgi:hypothetical protein